MQKSMNTRKTKRQTARFLRKIARGLPRIRVIRTQRSRIIVPGLLGVMGTLALGGVAALLLLRPRVRMRALEVAKDAYGKVRDQLETMGVTEKLGMHHRVDANGVVTETSSDYAPSAF